MVVLEVLCNKIIHNIIDFVTKDTKIQLGNHASQQIQ